MRPLHRKFFKNSPIRIFLRHFSSDKMSDKLIPYNCPQFAETLKIKPKFRVKLSIPETPIHKWDLPGVPNGFDVFIKRDDMTGSTLSGNKVRKLEFLMADAIDKGCKHVITCGGIQSNHCRATAVAARQLGLQPHLILRSDVQDITDVGSEGNLLLSRLCDAKLYMVPKLSPYQTQLKPRMEALVSKIKSDTGEDSYLIPVGGSNEIGMYGYINVFQEMISQGLLEDFDDIVFACGSGGTAEGLSISNYLTGSKLKIHGIAVSDNKAYFHDHVNNTLQMMDMDIPAEDILHVIEGHKGTGYGKSTQEELDFIFNVSSTTGIMLDPVYTGKAVKGLVHELNNNPHIFNGKRILFLHTGGIFGLYDGRINPMLETIGAKNNMVQMWPTVEDYPT